MTINICCYSPLHEPRLLCLDPAGHELLPPPLGLPDGGEQEDVQDDQGHTGHKMHANNTEPNGERRIQDKNFPRSNILQSDNLFSFSDRMTDKLV